MRFVQKKESVPLMEFESLSVCSMEKKMNCVNANSINDEISKWKLKRNVNSSFRLYFYVYCAPFHSPEGDGVANIKI